jgi:hypothetical protein
MRYQYSQEGHGKALETILEVVNFILLMIIVGTFNYLVINFLF